MNEVNIFHEIFEMLIGEGILPLAEFNWIRFWHIDDDMAGSLGLLSFAEASMEEDDISSEGDAYLQLIITTNGRVSYYSHLQEGEVLTDLKLKVMVEPTPTDHYSLIRQIYTTLSEQKYLPEAEFDWIGEDTWQINNEPFPGLQCVAEASSGSKFLRILAYTDGMICFMSHMRPDEVTVQHLF